VGSFKAGKWAEDVARKPDGIGIVFVVLTKFPCIARAARTSDAEPYLLIGKCNACMHACNDVLETPLLVTNSFVVQIKSVSNVLSQFVHPINCCANICPLEMIDFLHVTPNI